MARKIHWDEELMFTHAMLESQVDSSERAEEVFMEVMSRKRDVNLQVSAELRRLFDEESQPDRVPFS